VDLISKKTSEALVERSDISAVEPAAVVGEAAAAFELAVALLDKFGGDSVEDAAASYKAYRSRII
jgi:chorismate synthase